MADEFGSLIAEANYFIESSSENDVERSYDKDALSSRINEWFQTPVGSLADYPEWGHNLESFKFDPEDINFAVSIELFVVEKIPNDIEDLILKGIRVVFIEIDLAKVIIRHQFGDTVAQLKL